MAWFRKAERAKPAPVAAAPAIDGGIDIYGLVDLLVRRKWLVLGTAAAVIALGLVAIMMIGPRYAATARLLIDPRELRVVENELVQRGLGNDLILLESQVEVITSEAVLMRVVQRENLAADTEFYKPKAGAAETGRSPDEIALEALAKATKVTRAENTYVIEITVTSREAAKAARLANAIAAAYTQDQSDATASATRNVSSSIGDRLAELQTNLREAEQKVQDYKTANNVSNPEGRPLLDTRLNELSQRLSTAVGATAEAKSRLEVIETAMRERGDVASAASETENGTMVQLRTQLADAQRRLAELQQVLGPRHPRVAAASGEVDQVRRSIRAESERIVAATRDAYRSAQETEAAIAASLRDLTRTSFDANQKLIQLRELERQAQASRLVYESFLVRAKETAEQQNLGARTARIIAPAAIPDRTAFPPRSLLLLAAIAFGFGLGVFNAIAADFLVQRRLIGTRRIVEADPETVVAPAPAQPRMPQERVLVVFALDDTGVARNAAAGLAAASVSDGHSTLLCDIASSTGRPGLAELSRGEARMVDVLRRDASTGAHLVDAGNEAAGVSDAGLRDALAVFIGSYDRVVINAGAMDGEAAEATALALDYAEHAVLAVPGAEMTESETRALDELAGSGLGVSVVTTDDSTRLAA